MHKGDGERESKEARILLFAFGQLNLSALGLVTFQVHQRFLVYQRSFASLRAPKPAYFDYIWSGR